MIWEGGGMEEKEKKKKTPHKSSHPLYSKVNPRN